MNKKKIIALAVVFTVFCSITSCKKYLDIVPDNVAVIENAFKLRIEAEKYLFTCYSYLPKNGDGWFNAGMMSGDEIWLPQTDKAHWHPAFQIAQGEQNRSRPLFNEWGGDLKGANGGNNYLKMFRAIRHCNIFLQNIKDETKAPDLGIAERERWIGEVEFLKAYYHYYLMRMYGPIPLIDVNTLESSDPEGLYYKRAPIDETVNYLSALLDAATEKLPQRISDENKELGRITKPIALAVKAKLLLMAASPLFNGNSDYAGFKDKENTTFFNPVFDLKKWEKARDAAKAAIESAELNGSALYTYTNDSYGLSAETKTQLNIRNSVTTRWSTEHVWALSNSYFVNEALCMPPMAGIENVDRFQLQGVWGAPLKIAKMFYSKNGVPIEEDKTLDFGNYMQTRVANTSERFTIEPGFATARLNYDREPRFYADLGFDGSKWYMKDATSTSSDVNSVYVQSKNAERSGFGHFTNWNETGYFIKKLVHWESTTNTSNAPSWKSYPWPEIRLADLYLMYAEALNEVEPGSVTAISYVDRVRTRAGLKGVVESWTNYSKSPSKYTSQAGLREIIRRERLIELAFEGQRLWDLRRWKLSGEELNKDITGLSVLGKTAESYNIERTIFSQTFIAPRDYFWPVGDNEIRKNPKLVENPGW
ncbi:RagB/SusD family nutrient uptake outer membrane protein [Pedobacter alluvionis]|uniref:Putative outer membrane starch-binding protein n=1 Tax=Pedobacter alluvionis TaxID=475253 RepID=A0A497XTJ4_9SPHI|nr:RagB/SusD family nutrient uptake outer membrane protein [Pedobacter alluvionis]RLJ72750.1 putative outer membrane starch-binding protein [Pedobacter alluvionis]TFB29406.1 RagB/SusD family nutrient uptake outer membrane protein [Pedobacter alluvionis]